MSDTLDRLRKALADRYTIERRLGEGGMATVYLAQDLRHDRKVALKVLKPELAAVLGAERFVQEIKTTASLQHPHILPLFDSGEADGFLYYVMPYIDGETLRDRLSHETQLGIDEAVRITTEVADALDYAHRNSVIHRDIKPENILLQDGRPMVADFGIALAVSAAAGGRLTETGLSLGTPHYMSPEQATAEKELTSKSDVYSLGCVLYEMLTGEPPHTGASAQAIVMKIVTEDVRPVTALRKSVPPHVAAATAVALEKLAADRFESAAKFAEALTNPAFTVPTVSGVAAAPTAAAPGRWKLLAFGLGFVAVVATMVAVWSFVRDGQDVRVVRHRMVLWDQMPAALSLGEFPIYHGAALAPDGSAIAYVDIAGDQLQLMLKFEGELRPMPLAGTDGATVPFFSPDGRWIGFLADGALKKVPSAGGAAVTLADSASPWGGGVWLDDGTIVFAGSSFDLRRVNEAGGESEVLVPQAQLGTDGAFMPSPLPDGRGVVFTGCTGGFECDGYVYDARRGTARVLLEDAKGTWYLPTGHLVFSPSTGGLFATALDLETLEITGSAIPVLDDLRPGNLSFSQEGTALYMVGGSPSVSQYEVVWVDRSGQVELVDPGWTFPMGGPNWGMALSPDHERLAIQIGTGLARFSADIWVKEFSSGRLSRLTRQQGFDGVPRWTPDGQYVTFVSSRRATPFALYRRRADHTGEAELLVAYEERVIQGFHSPDGAWLVLRTSGVAGARGGRDILGFRPGVDTIPIPLVATDVDEQAPAISPDGRWLAYLSDETGRNEVFVRPFPNTDDGKWQVSDGGAHAPLWAHSGRELFFMTADRDMVAVAIDGGRRFTSGQPQVLFRASDDLRMSVVTGEYDISADDQRFLMRQRVAADEDATEPYIPLVRRVVLVQNWFKELREKMGG